MTYPITDTLEEATALLHRIESAAKEVGLHINVDKNEYKLYNNQGGTEIIIWNEIKTSR